MSNTFFFLLILAAFFLSIGQIQSRNPAKLVTKTIYFSPTGNHASKRDASCRKICDSDNKCFTYAYENLGGRCELLYYDNDNPSSPGNLQMRPPIMRIGVQEMIECKKTCETLAYCMNFFFNETNRMCEMRFTTDKSKVIGEYVTWSPRVYKYVERFKECQARCDALPFCLKIDYGTNTWENCQLILKTSEFPVWGEEIFPKGLKMTTEALREGDTRTTFNEYTYETCKNACRKNCRTFFYDRENKDCTLTFKYTGSKAFASHFL